VSVLATYMTIVDRMQYMLLWRAFNCVLARGVGGVRVSEILGIASVVVGP
jgi:hypothetical protein